MAERADTPRRALSLRDDLPGYGLSLSPVEKGNDALCLLGTLDFDANQAWIFALSPSPLAEDRKEGNGELCHLGMIGKVWIVPQSCGRRQEGR